MTNDDGIDSAGLAALSRVAASVGLEVVVAAPAWNSSGASAAITAVYTDGHVKIEHRQPDGFEATAVYAVHGSPAYIVRAAFHDTFGPAPDIVLSGMNLGANTGRAILHSGTVGAVLTGASFGSPGAAFSIDSAMPSTFECAADIARTVVDYLVSEPAGPIALNVNVPDRVELAHHGVVSATLAPIGTVQSRVTEEGGEFVPVAIDDPTIDAMYDDVALLRSGYATVTALLPVCQATDVDLTRLTNMAMAR